MKPHQSIDRGDGIVTVEGSPPNDTAARERQGYPAALGGFMDLALCGRGSFTARALSAVRRDALLWCPVPVICDSWDRGWLRRECLPADLKWSVTRLRGAGRCRMSGTRGVFLVAGVRGGECSCLSVRSRWGSWQGGVAGENVVGGRRSGHAYAFSGVNASSHRGPE